ncbi:D-alanyl-D-alanine carboxypeptidase family protein [Curtobacterium flaccumfaciens]|uniref:D-alanyl-D-alanine carboxypeptidase family protein n=1 Tax=Curtobacterium flaccumfaciens TaxID=2035 RepID=UPI0013E998CD|nr:D-alanyl-D-alanine carboxypeptidase [Curtobacterium flaccumfaciens]MBF4626253.1 D-alanyl-D-alanine carboxypeptidase [Curtobacterium flaccumfaciens]MCS0646118.1 D-alanyl-D-alanine carboxypeptidase [Curtobacterium flaccumfaciens pv. flaccumfaciens]MCS6526507.1 D-alanyl-D-alanine carboxypeptidase [Curtobacterium flaccumfaciens pv. flaccumfaciens]MCS6528139.1 D-alanyl-D-alanine carboxypeptidase [Curtobacterium flaccumfaciens pv. flaccumfaciens]NUU11951.1 D-alanyl-D-alanine carboxypeptidase [Cur
MSRVVRRPRSAVRRPVTISVVAVLLLVAGYLVAAAVVPFGPASASTTTYSAPKTTVPALSFPGYGATAVEATDFPESLRTSGDTKPRSIASITKVVTALVVLDEKPMAVGESGPSIRFTKQMEGLYAKYAAQNGEVAPMPAGLKLTEHQTFQVMLMKSANNYAGALAIWAFGSIAAYEHAANDWLDEHGLDDTTIHEPTGLDPDNTSTATDLVELGQLALANPVVKDIVGTQDVTIPTVGEIENSNKLLGLDGIEGIKTGTLDEAGACLLFAATYERGGKDVTVVGVMLGGVDHDSLDVDVQRLLRSVADNFQVVTLTHQGQTFGTFSTPWQDEADAVTTKAAEVLVWGKTTVTAKAKLEQVTFGTKGERVGQVRFRISDHDPVTVPLVLERTIDDPGVWWRWTNPFQGA